MNLEDAKFANHPHRSIVSLGCFSQNRREVLSFQARRALIIGTMSVDLREYLWVAVCGGILGFGYGFLIGANDVANAFASSVSSKSVSLKQAVIIASIFEFSGAFFLGASVTGTIRSKIVSTDLYDDEPEVLMFGMFTSLFSAVIMLFIATHLGLPVSTTHDIVGSIMGFSIAAKGFHSIDWDVARTIFVSWAVSPIFSGGVAAIFFGAIKFIVMKSQNPYKRAYWTFPVVLTIGVGIDLFYILYKASSNFSGFKERLKLSWVLPTSFGAGAFLGLIWVFLIGPIAKRRVEAHRDAAIENDRAATDHDIEDVVDDIDDDIEDPTSNSGSDEDAVVDGANDKIAMKPHNNDVDDDEGAEDKEAREAAVQDTNENALEQPQRGGIFGAIGRFHNKIADSTYNQDLHAQSMHENARAAKIWDDGEKFDPDAESLFTYLQVFTACLNSFAHGANDVSNTIAPLSAIIQIYQDNAVEPNSKVQKWVLAYGGAAIILGLLLYGYRVMKSIGYKLTLMSPSRGASAELASSLVVVTASFNEIPVSSTQCIVGAISGVGLIGGVRNVQWYFLARVCVGWVVLFFAATLLSAGIFSFAAFSPSLASPVGEAGID